VLNISCLMRSSIYYFEWGYQIQACDHEGDKQPGFKANLPSGCSNVAAIRTQSRYCKLFIVINLFSNLVEHGNKMRERKVCLGRNKHRSS
jgi:hypothetical protein